MQLLCFLSLHSLLHFNRRQFLFIEQRDETIQCLFVDALVVLLICIQGRMKISLCFIAAHYRGHKVVRGRYEGIWMWPHLLQARRHFFRNAASVESICADSLVEVNKLCDRVGKIRAFDHLQRLLVAREFNISVRKSSTVHKRVHYHCHGRRSAYELRRDY